MLLAQIATANRLRLCGRGLTRHITPYCCPYFGRHLPRRTKTLCHNTITTSLQIVTLCSRLACDLGLHMISPLPGHDMPCICALREGRLVTYCYKSVGKWMTHVTDPLPSVRDVMLSTGIGSAAWRPGLPRRVLPRHLRGRADPARLPPLRRPGPRGCRPSASGIGPLRLHHPLSP